jgi:RNA polymerase sigma-70 factor (ECF subfamily)
MRLRSELSVSKPAGAGGEDAPTSAAGVDDCAVPLPELPFAEFVRAEFKWVWRVLRRLGLSPADADDATQQVFLVVARRSAEVPRARSRSFLYQTAIRVTANAVRSLRRRRDVPSEDLGEHWAHEPPLDELLEQRRARRLLDELLAQLPPELARVLVLAEIEQLTAQQIAELEGLPAGTVSSRLRRARAQFYRLLEQAQQRNPFDRRCS